ncbi:DUF2635 domain-containing protein [Methylobacterium sp. E-041]|uniref:DUF2635 domain-containing protein n=1 Tax=Methylobacterium sp. E-041 TaxID=2836573 RepID=UPI001FBBE890|nr:DUF2635 domain-containing protein [Methylobacterium sp. E-041]MCJ2108031.1 DUF2635 domain-containing protein [Methylobacterium sp. E-041]
MRKHVAPAHEGASIPDPARGRDLPREGIAVAWTAYWAGLQLRGDVVVTEIVDEPEPALAEPVEAPEPDAADASAPAV